VVYVYLLPNPWITDYRLYDTGVLDEYQEIHPGRPQKSIALSIIQIIGDNNLFRGKPA
jgi:hypothetical protein